MTRQGVVRRTVYLLTGGAIAIAFLILASSLYAPLQPDSEADLRLFVPLTLGMMVGVGLLRASVLAALGPLPYALVRLTWLTPWPLLGPTRGAT